MTRPMMNEDGTTRTMTAKEFAKALKRFPKNEQDFILDQRQKLGLDTPALSR